MCRSFDSKFSVQLTGSMVTSPGKVGEGSDNRRRIGLEEVFCIEVWLINKKCCDSFG